VEWKERAEAMIRRCHTVERAEEDCADQFKRD
jgi:hypothetical protein